MDRYGVNNPMFSDEIKGRMQAKNVEKYGVPWTFMLDSVQDKCQKTILERYGRFCICATALSRPHRDLSDFLTKNGIFHENEKSGLFSGRKPNGRPWNPIPDIYIDSHKLCIEVFGTYWHADPRFFKANDLLKAKNKTAEEIWGEDKQRLEYIQSQGFTTLVVWQEDIQHGTGKEDLVSYLRRTYEL